MSAISLFPVRKKIDTTPDAAKPQIAGTKGLSPAEAQRYRNVISGKADGMASIMMRALMTREGSLAMGNMIAAARQLIGVGEGPKAVPADIDIAQYNASIQSQVKSIQDMMMRARFSEGAGRAYGDLVMTFEAQKK